MTDHRRGDARGDVLATLVAGAVEAADTLLATGAGQVLVRQVAARLTANAVAARGHLPAGLDTPGDPHGRCTLLAAPGGTDEPARAAAVTAAAITVSQCDEGLRESRGHPGLHAYAAALAATEADDRSLRVFLRALAVGWEVGARLGLLLGAPRPGVHPHGGWGTGAAAAAAGIVTGQDTAGVTDTVNLALTVALAGPEADTRRGHAAHYLLPALGTANGLTVARLADAGFPATGPALPHLARTVHHGGTDRPVDVALGSRPLLPDAYFKPVGVCAHTLTGWTVARAMARDLTADEVATVTVDTYAGAALLAERRPVGRLARQFSIPWVVACGLVGTDPGAPDGPADDRWARAARLAERVTVRHDPGLDQGYPAGRPAVVEVTTRSGARLTGRARFHHGDREDPMTADELAAVDAALLRTPGVPAGAAELLHGLTRAPGATRLRDLTALVRGGAPNPNGGPPPVPAGPGPSGRKDMTSW
ncbi:MmgE/PrpD family protein [Micromonospora antibiotica]|uniref:MmgE/PrpD family protein n=1 Tax=Micromonospora antibiotica TaxID=2807623 RepID=A0ABS3V582_9ACTN|nr:MmgE/PrpD family protein [Micromonospora antibiotica]MBO4160697.1 MmgE/PrpD family protein [Micromonospora antibiotica]